MENEINLERLTALQLLELINKESSEPICKFCNKQDLKSWDNITEEIDSNIKAIGKFEQGEKDMEQNGYTEYHPDETNYWSLEAPIAIHFYPYHESIINVCEKCNAVHLTYTDYAGHGPQHRIRYVDKSLVVG